MDEGARIVPIDLGAGVTVWVETGEVQTPTTEIRSAAPIPSDVVKTIEDAGRAVLAAARALGPDKFTAEFGIELGGEAGIPFVTKGTAKSVFKISLEWSGPATD